MQGYFRYLDDIVIIYNYTFTNINEVLSESNILSPSLNFTLKIEGNNKMNFLDITMLQHLNVIEKKIYRKPTTTDCIIPADSCHPREHKISGIRFLLDRIMKHLISYVYQGEEKKIILVITRNNQFNQNSVKSIKKEKDKFGSVAELVRFKRLKRNLLLSHM